MESMAVNQVSDANIDEIVDRHSLIQENPNVLTNNRLDWWIRNRHENGLEASGAILRLGKEFFFIKPRFMTWLFKQKA